MYTQFMTYMLGTKTYTQEQVISYSLSGFSLLLEQKSLSYKN